MKLDLGGVECAKVVEVDVFPEHGQILLQKVPGPRLARSADHVVDRLGLLALVDGLLDGLWAGNVHALVDNGL